MVSTAQVIIGLGVVAAALIVVYISRKKKDRENFNEPILQNYEKMVCDNQPRSNGSIYGECSHLMSGYPYYDKAY